MKKTITSVLTCALALGISAQSVDKNWFKMYHRTSGRGDAAAIPLDTGSFLAHYDNTFYIISTSGDSLDSFSHSPFFTSQMLNVGGDVYLVGSENGFPAVGKLNASNGLDWSKVVSGNSGELLNAIESNDGNIIAVGEGASSSMFMAKFDANGDTTWAKQLQQTTFTQLSDVIELSDGNYLAGGNVDDYPYAVKFDNNGDTLWTYFNQVFVSFQKMSLKEQANGNLLLVARNHLITLDQNGSEQSVEHLGNRDFYSLVESNDHIYLVGAWRDTASNTYPYIEVWDNNLDSVASYMQTGSIYGSNYNTFHDHAVLANGGIVAVGEVEDSVSLGNNDNLLGAMLFNSTPTGLAEAGFKQVKSAGIFPNPAIEKTSISLENPVNGTLELTDIHGRVVLRKNIAGEQLIELQVSGFQPGVYSLKINTEDQVYINTLIKKQ